MGYADSSWATASAQFKSLGGFTLNLGHNVVSHNCKLSTTICTSTAHAEISAASELFKAQLWLGGFMSELEPTVDAESCGRYTIFEDNAAAIAWSEAPNVSNKTRHFSVKYHFVKEAVTEKMLKLEYTPTKEQVADIFTKALDRELFGKFRSAMGVVPRETYELGGVECRKVMGWS
jgi:hypothetical protein